MLQYILKVSSPKAESLIDITREIESFVSETALEKGILQCYVQGATAALMIQENWDESVQEDVLDYLRKQIPKGVWRHDVQDGNGDAHIKAGLLGPDLSIPLIGGKLGLSTWQNIFLCEFDGPRNERKIVLTLMGE